MWHYRDADPDFGHWQVPPWAYTLHTQGGMVHHGTGALWARTVAHGKRAGAGQECQLCVAPSSMFQPCVTGSRGWQRLSDTAGRPGHLPGCLPTLLRRRAMVALTTISTPPFPALLLFFVDIAPYFSSKLTLVECAGQGAAGTIWRACSAASRRSTLRQYIDIFFKDMCRPGSWCTHLEERAQQRAGGARCVSNLHFVKDICTPGICWTTWRRGSTSRWSTLRQ